MSINVLTISGFIGRDPVLRKVGDKSVCTLAVPCDSGYGDNRKTTWVSCDVWGNLAEHAAENLRKGSFVTVSGEFSLDTYNDKDGQPRTIAKMFVRSIAWGKSAAAPAQPAQRPNNGAKPQPARRQPAPAAADDDLLDDVL